MANCRRLVVHPILVFLLLLSAVLYSPSFSQDDSSIVFLGQVPFRAYVSRGVPPLRTLYQFFAVHSLTLLSDGITYSVAAGEDLGGVDFFINADTGQLFSRNYFPQFGPTSYELTVKAMSSLGEWTETAHLIIYITPESDTTPRYEHSQYTIEIPEDMQATLPLLAVQAFSLNPKSFRALYGIVDGNVDGDFAITSHNGLLRVQRELDRERTGSYVLTVRYVDDFSSVDTTVCISILDINDNTPQFTEVLYNVTIPENTAVNSVILNISATDPDFESRGRLNYALNSSMFSLDSLTGEVRLNLTTIDYEIQRQYQFNVIAMDEGEPPLSSQATIFVNVANIDDECPRFDSPVYIRELPYDPDNEMVPTTGMEVLTVMAIDPDKISDVVYSIASGNDEEVLTLDPNTGVISLTNLASNDPRGQYNIIVYASDASCINHSSVRVEVGIGNVNEHSPSFQGACEASIPENPPMGTIVTSLLATDGDSGINGDVKYAFNTPHELFTINPSNGEVQTTQPAESYDRETQALFQISVTATDGGHRQDYCLLTIILEDVNDNAPMFQLDVTEYQTSLALDAPLNTFILQVHAEDIDLGNNGTIDYSIEYIDQSQGFSVEISQSGVITTNSIIPLSLSPIAFLAMATDRGSPSLSSSVEVTVSITNGNLIPVFQQQNYSVTLCENAAPMTLVSIVNASTADTTDLDFVIYDAPEGTDYQSNQNGIFGVTVDGEVMVTANGHIDYELLPAGRKSFIFFVSAVNSDGRSLTLIEVTVLDYNDNPPELSPILSLAIAENEPIGTTLTRLQASDPDSGTNGEIAYRLEGSSNHFNVNPNGIITTKMEFNAEDPPPAADLSLIITAFNPNPSIDTSGLCPNGTSGESRTLVKVLLLDQNDNPPTFNQSQVSLTLREDYQVASTVYTFEASDPDSSDQEQLSYSITDGNIGVAFEIFNTGLLTLAQRLDYEAVTAYMLQVQVTDGLHTDTATISITIMNIDDEPPVFTSASYFAQIIENTPLGSLVLTVEATDPDSASVSYSLKGLAIGRFSIGNDGRIVVSGPVDREEFSGGTVKFLVFAEGGRLATANVEVNILDINDYHPRFLPPLNGQVTENRQPEDTGLLVMTVTAIDLDEGVNGTLTYALISDPQSGFQIDSITGDITAHREYDRESTPSFVLVVIAMDNGVVIQLNSTAEVVIYIGDVDDNEPFFLYPYMFVRIFEGSPIHTPVIYIPALDPDNGDNALITFFLESTSPNMVKYDLNSTTGEITVVSPLDYGTIQDRLYSLCLSLENGSNVQGKLDIELLDRNNHSPQVTESVLPFGNSIPENSPVETILARISASDGDEGSNGKLVFNITAGDPDSDFRLNVEEGMGIVRVVALDRERRSSYSLEIAISDSGCPVRSTTFELHFTITDVNDMAPKFVQDSYTGSVVENEGPVGSILKVNATDPDTEDGGMISSYQILSGDPDRNFTLDNQTGILGSVMSLDREEKSDYLLTIVAVDGGLVPLTGTTTAVITVTDVDDNPPRSGGEMELHIVAPNGQLTAGEIAPVFFIDPDSESLLQNCNVFNKVSATQFDANERCYITTAVNPPEQMVRFGITGSDGVHGAITTYANLTVEYIPNVSLMPEFLVTITLNIAPSDYLSSGTSVFPLMLTSVLGISMSQLTILSVQAGYHDAETTTDVTLSVQSDGLLLRPAAIVQDIYLQRAALLASGFPLLALPTDPCVTEPCMNEAACTITTSIGETQILARSSTGNVVFYGPRINLGYQCECVPGTSGHDCEVNYNDCYSNPCLYGAKCSDGVNGHVCDCPEGTGGVDCSFNPDECTSSPCQNGATCFNGLGSYECVCPLGYYGRECQYQYFQPSSYCNSNPCLNGAECSPGRDSFTCLCPRGFTGDRCQDAVLIQGGCTGNPCYNGSTCIGTSDGYTCICSVGFTGPHCRWPLNNCELEPCKNGGHCLAGFYGSHQCICPSGLTGEDCSSIIPACDASPCLNEGRCLDIEGGFHTCECTREFRGTNCEFPLQVDNLCSSNPCHNVSICTSGREAFTCSCPANYTGSDCSLESASLDPCGSNPCQYGSTCLPQQDTMTNYSCVCSDGFEGRNCELNIDDCDPNPCQNGGTCQDKIAGFICNCPEEIAGRVCDVFCPFGHRGDFCEISPQYCDPNPCNNDGICTVNANLAGYTCSCLPGFTGTTCDVAVQCQSSLCLNGGSCISVSGGGIRCECQSGYNGDHCELQVVSFSGSQNQSSYRAFDSLQIRGQGSLSFQFATLDSEALLLYNTQYQFGTSRDHLAVAITGGNLQLMVSHGEDGGAGVMVVSRAVRVNDGLWHDVLIESSGTTIHVLLDFCHELQEGLLEFADCTATAATKGTMSFLDFGLPLWIGGVPFTPAAPHPITSQGMTGCVRDLKVNGNLIDLENYVHQLKSQQGCPQLENGCSSNPCEEGTCNPTWSSFRCVCQPLVAGDNCEETAPSLTFSGSNYAQYMLQFDTQRKRQVSVLRSSFEEQVSLRFQTREEEGILFYIGDEESGDFAALQLHSGEVLYRVNLGNGEENLRVTGIQVSNNTRHAVDVTRSGLHVVLTLNGDSYRHTLSGTHLALDTTASDVYAAGRPGTAQGFMGCIQDVRLNNYSLPTSGSNSYASVVFIGASEVTTGCATGPCLPYPCGSGECTELTDNTFVCTCPNGQSQFTPCIDSSRGPMFSTWAAIIGASLGTLLILILFLVGMCYGHHRWSEQRKRRYVIGTGSKQPTSSELISPSQCMVISNEAGGGEMESPIDWSDIEPTKENFLRIDSTATTPIIPRAEIEPPSEDDDLETVELESIPDKTDAAPMLVRANSPTIKAFITEQVKNADEEVTDIDSMRHFKQEEAGSPTGSLSSICSSLDNEHYTMSQLKSAGPKFREIAELLEGILIDDEYLDSASEATHTSYLSEATHTTQYSTT